MDKLSYLLAFLIMIVGGGVFGTYIIEFPFNYIICGCWGLIVAIGAIKIDTFVSKSISESKENQSI